jgi:hypothetical protein
MTGASIVYSEICGCVRYDEMYGNGSFVCCGASGEWWVAGTNFVAGSHRIPICRYTRVQYIIVRTEQPRRFLLHAHLVSCSFVRNVAAFWRNRAAVGSLGERVDYVN